MASIINVDQIAEATSGSGVHIPGHVIQVVGNHLNTVVTTTGTTFADTGLTATLTPKKSTSKFLILVNLGIVSSSTNDGVMFRLLRNSTVIGSATGANNYDNFIQVWPNSAYIYVGGANHFYDTPSTASQIVYKLQWAMTGGTDTGYINRRSSGNYARTSSNFTVQEIAQ